MRTHTKRDTAHTEKEDEPRGTARKELASANCLAY